MLTSFTEHTEIILRNEQHAYFISFEQIIFAGELLFCDTYKVNRNNGASVTIFFSVIKLIVEFLSEHLSESFYYREILYSNHSSLFLLIYVHLCVIFKS